MNGDLSLSIGLHQSKGRALLPHGQQVFTARSDDPIQLTPFNRPMAQTTGYFHLHLISDSTGETLITVARAAAAQYAKVMPVEHVHPLVRTQKQLDRVLVEIEETPGIVLSHPLQEDL